MNSRRLIGVLLVRLAQAGFPGKTNCQDWRGEGGLFREYPSFTAGGSAFGDDGHLHVMGVTDNAMDKVSSDEPRPRGVLGTHHEKLRDVMKPSEVEQSGRDILTLQDPGFDVKVSREVEVALHGFPFGCRQRIEILFGKDEYSKTVGLEIIRHSLATADEHGRGGMLRDVDENPVGQAAKITVPRARFFCRFGRDF